MQEPQHATGHQPGASDGGRYAKLRSALGAKAELNLGLSAQLPMPSDRKLEALRWSHAMNTLNQQSGAMWRFSKPYMRDWRVGEVARPRLAVSLAVEASSAFPRFLSPLFPCSTLGSRRRKSPPALADARAPVPSRSLRRRAALDVG
jgi:hypothetical protein